MENEPKGRNDWFLLIEEYESSKQTRSEFCRQKGLIISRFSYYLHSYRKKNNSSINKEAPSFSQVTISQPASSSNQEIKIELPNGFRCQVPFSISPEALKKIMGALLSC